MLFKRGCKFLRVTLFCMRRSAAISGLIIVVLGLIAFFVWSAALNSGSGKLRVSFLDVGEGDAIFIMAPSGRKVLIDGGPDTSVLRELAKNMPWFDRHIDAVIATHPDADHISGLIDVIDRYDVSYFMCSSVDGSTDIADELEHEVQQKVPHEVVAKRGQIIDLGDGAYLEVLSPDRALPHTDTNVACVVTRLVYGATSFLFSCDAPQAMEKYLVQLDGKGLHADVLKAGHHGSKTSSSALFIGYVDPSYAVYSRGCNNSYGFPSKETIDTFKRFDVPTLDTCTDGSITFTSDGEKVVRE